MEKHRYTKDEVNEWRKNHGNFAYFNTQDSNFAVQKMYGIGWTLNWAHPISWVIGAAIIALIVYSLFFKQ